jgi:uncharacterized repeat protein (TIGR01451 family)
VVFYDVLEDENGDWQGTIYNVDVALAQSRGIGPKIYYSTLNGLEPVLTIGSNSARSTEYCLKARVIDVDNDGVITPVIMAPPQCDHSVYGHPHVCEWPEEEGTPVWHRVPANKIKNGIWTVPTALAPDITAIAIDLSKNMDGVTDRVFMNGDSVVCYVTMRAPDSKQDGQAVNRMSYFTNQTPVKDGDPVEGGLVVPTVKLSNNTYVTMDDLNFDIRKSSNPASGSGAANPVPVNIGEIIEYTIRLENLTPFTVGYDDLLGLEVVDIIPAGLDIITEGIVYFFGNSSDFRFPVIEKPNPDSNNLVTYQVNGQTLTFRVATVQANQVINLVIPVNQQYRIPSGVPQHPAGRRKNPGRPPP